MHMLIHGDIYQSIEILLLINHLNIEFIRESEVWLNLQSIRLS